LPVVMLFVLALASSLDSLGVGVAYGLSGTRVRFTAHISIGIVMLAITWGSVALGNRISHYLPDQVTHIGSALIFAGIGLWTLLPMLRRKSQSSNETATLDPNRRLSPTAVLEALTRADIDHSRDIDWREGVLLGVALSLNNIGGGISAGLIHIGAAEMALLSVFFNVVCLTGGHLLGVQLRASRISDYAQAVSGVLLIAVGLWQLH
jgi:putative sporulation protein YtaF